MGSARTGGLEGERQTWGRTPERHLCLGPCLGCLSLASAKLAVEVQAHLSQGPSQPVAEAHDTFQLLVFHTREAALTWQAELPAIGGRAGSQEHKRLENILSQSVGQTMTQYDTHTPT